MGIFLDGILLYYKVFDNERNEALFYNFGQKDAYDVGHVAKASYINDILISGFENKQRNFFRQN